MPEITALQLLESLKDPLSRAYNRTTHLQMRREMMQKWADYLDELKLNGEKLSRKSLILKDVKNSKDSSGLKFEGC